MEGYQALLFAGMSMEAVGPVSEKTCDLPLGHATDTLSVELVTAIVSAIELGSAMEA